MLVTPRRGVRSSRLALVSLTPHDPAVAAQAVAAEASLLEELRHARELHIAELRDRACAAIEQYVDVLRIAGKPPERVVIAIKDVARNAGPVANRDIATAGAYTIHELLIEEIVSCAIRRYFQGAT
jgi:hypothetical protein